MRVCQSGAMLSLVFNYTPWDKRTSVCSCAAARLEEILQGWTDKARWGEVWFSLASRPRFTFCSRCAVAVKGLVADRAVMYCTGGVLKAPDACCCSVCALAIGTSTHSDRHLPFCSNPFYTSSPDDKSYFPYRHSEKERGEKQLKRRWWVEHLSPSHCFQSRMYCI